MRLLLLLTSLFLAAAHAALFGCLGAIPNNTVLTNSSAEWANITTPYNYRVPVVPAVVAVPGGLQALQAILACAREDGKIKVSPLGGGHSFVTYGLGGVDGALVISMRNFKGLEIQKDGVVVKVGGGSLVGELISYLNPLGRAFPHARGTSVGVVGSTIGGGFGTMSRKLGTTLDTVVALDIVLPNGTVAHASESENPDLLFASLGAGSSFGVITNLYLKTGAAPTHNVTVYTWTFGVLTPEQAADIYSTYQGWAQTVTGDLSVRISWGVPNATTISGVYYGDGDFASVTKPMLAQLPSPISRDEQSLSFADSEVVISGELVMSTRDNARPTSYLQSAIAEKPLSNDTLLAYTKYLWENSASTYNLTIWAFTDLWGSPEGTPTANLTAFPHQNTIFLTRIDGNTVYSGPDSYETTQPFPNGGIPAMRKFLDPIFDAEPDGVNGKRSYVNYRDSAYSQEEWSERYYSDSFAKLQELKAVYDPTALMNANPQSIPLPAGAY